MGPGPAGMALFLGAFCSVRGTAGLKPGAAPAGALSAWAYAEEGVERCAPEEADRCVGGRLQSGSAETSMP
ncbi:hypothetical protein TRIP_B330086 [uncultured Desulfatiglans sp.]|uniref:Uncharacterized protein n=1 Tax=Uncultured Desulfatiglans sp. TaxID=1748965 RepID=A0A653A8D1_UNCDX|nr:hypothetical protein TRIP_B330086 [uncultured Desulfatiglans sp.]